MYRSQCASEFLVVFHLSDFHLFLKSIVFVRNVYLHLYLTCQSIIDKKEISLSWKGELEFSWEQILLKKSTCCILTETSSLKFRFSQWKYMDILTILRRIHHTTVTNHNGWVHVYNIVLFFVSTCQTKEERGFFSHNQQIVHSTKTDLRYILSVIESMMWITFKVLQSYFWPSLALVLITHTIINFSRYLCLNRTEPSNGGGVTFERSVDKWNHVLVRL